MDFRTNQVSRKSKQKVYSSILLRKRKSFLPFSIKKRELFHAVWKKDQELMSQFFQIKILFSKDLKIDFSLDFFKKLIESIIETIINQIELKAR